MFEKIEKSKPQELAENLDVARLKERVNELFPELLETFKTLHENPELGGEEFETAKHIKNALEEMGVDVLASGLGGTGIVAEIVGKEKGPTIALRADIDALKLTENPAHEIVSKKAGVMHACGHDMHTTSLLGATKLLKEMSDSGKLDGRVILIFQSNEEKAVSRASGSIPVIKYLEKNGIRERICAFFAIHVVSVMERGTIRLTEGLQFAGTSFVDVKLKTIGGHGSQIKVLPDIDYMLSDIKIKVADAMVDYWKNDEAVIDSMAPRTTHEADNIMLSSGGRSWILRVMTEDYRKISKEAHGRIKQIVQDAVSVHMAKTKERAESKGEKGNASNYDVQLDISIHPHTRPTIHRDQKLVNIVAESSRSVLDNFKWQKENSPATDDFSFFLEKLRGKEIPGVYLSTGGANIKNGYPYVPHHSPEFAVDPEALKDLTEIHVATVANALRYFNLNQKKDK
ncbi:MAG: M20 family metallopeptidase [Candidatus Moraniibacteriota bacterium]